MKTILSFLLALVSLPAFGQFQYRPTAYTGPFVSTITNAADARTYLGISGSSTNNALLNGTNTFTGPNTFSVSITSPSYGSSQQTLAYSSGTNITVDASKVLHFVSLTNTAYFGQPSNIAVGASFTVILKQDATGARAVTFNTNYWKFPSGTQPSITTNASAYSVLSCIADPYGTNVFCVSTLDVK